MSELAATISPMPREIIAKVVPARRVVTYPKATPKSRPAPPPTRGIKVMGKCTGAMLTARSACIETKAPRP